MITNGNDTITKFFLLFQSVQFYVQMLKCMITFQGSISIVSEFAMRRAKSYDFVISIKMYKEKVIQ